MNLSVEAVDDVTVVTPMIDRLDSMRTLEFKEAMRSAIAGSDGTMVLNMQEVEFLDSSGLGAIVAMAKVLGDDRKLEISNLGTMVAKVFHLTRMDQIFTIHETAPKAA